MIRPL
jgi:hypothetical protein